jgi:hypothetical protein
MHHICLIVFGGLTHQGQEAVVEQGLGYQLL